MRYLRPDSIHQWTDGDYLVTTDPARVDIEVVQRFMVEESYWARDRTQRELEHAIALTRPYSLIYEPTGEQVGFARVLTDATWFAWIADVFVLEGHRGGRGKFIMRCITEDLAGVRRVVLGTRDAHGLYAQFGFRPVAEPANWMERMRPAG